MHMEIPEVSEDCLYLNIYTPAKPAQEAKLPVSDAKSLVRDPISMLWLLPKW